MDGARNRLLAQMLHLEAPYGGKGRTELLAVMRSTIERSVGEPLERCDNSARRIRISDRKTHFPARRAPLVRRFEHLDLATVIKVSQAVSSEIVLENLTDTLMHTAMEQVGAERALLIMWCGLVSRQ
ncbi:hypothetical protein V1282_005716 [Nitrobacteraceae bacterium AZCC 2146]